MYIHIITVIHLTYTYINNMSLLAFLQHFFTSNEDLKCVTFCMGLCQVVMGDIRQSLLPRDVLSAAKELLYHLDIYICNLVQSGRQPPQVDSKTLELVEEFILHSPKDRNTPARVSYNPAYMHAHQYTVYRPSMQCAFISENERPPGAAAAGDHVQLFPGAES